MCRCCCSTSDSAWSTWRKSNSFAMWPTISPLLSYPSPNQGCGSGCGLDPDSIGSVNPGRIRNPDPGGQKWPTKVEKYLKVHVLKCWMASLWAEGFFCNLDILYGGLGISKFFFSCYYGRVFVLDQKCPVIHYRSGFVPLRSGI
jgi:hypothetical protein